MPHPSFAELSQSLAGLSKSLVQQVESMNVTILAAVEASQKESDELVKKNQALQAALLAKASQAGAVTTSQASVTPRSFTDNLTGGVVMLMVFNREVYVHRSILSSIPFFEAKLMHWSDEPVKLPEEITEPAFDNLLMRLYVGVPLPAKDVVLCAQIIHLAKYWLLDVIVTEMIAEVLHMAKKEDIPVLEELAKRFEIEELFAAVDKMQKLQNEPPCSLKDLGGLVGRALMTGDGEAKKLCSALLKEHPQACHVLREQFSRRDLHESSAETYRSAPVYDVNLCPGFQWFWKEVRGAGLLKTDLPFVSNTLMYKLNDLTGYRVNELGYSGGLVGDVNDDTDSTVATALETCGDRMGLRDPVSDLIDAALDRLHMGSLQPMTDLLASMPTCLLKHDSTDAKLAKLITSLPLATTRRVFQMLMGRITDVGPKTATALQKSAAGET